MALFIVLIGASAFIFSPAKNLLAYPAYVLILTAIFIGICWLKGEPPQWKK